MRLNVACIATPQHPVGYCRVKMGFVDEEGVFLTEGSSFHSDELTTRIPIRGVSSLELQGDRLVTGPAIRKVVRAVVFSNPRDFLADRLAMNVEVFDTVTGRAAVKYAFEPCRVLPFAFVPKSQRPQELTGLVRELNFAPPGIAVDETASLNVVCNPNESHPLEPCDVVLRYSPYELSPIAEQAFSIQPGAIGSFVLSGDMLGATPGNRAMIRPSVVATPATLSRLVTGFEILESATGITHSNDQPPTKRRPIFLR